MLLTASIMTAALPLIHPFGPVRQQRSQADLPENPVIERSCRNCHSERTEWPLYSYLPGVGWLVEKDVAEAREHMNLSRWTTYSAEQRINLLARIAAEVRNQRMPPARYTLLHPKARLSDAEIQQVYQWTRAERRKLRPR
jgi:hypothetical protein